jgi:hypothetical protein
MRVEEGAHPARHHGETPPLRGAPRVLILGGTAEARDLARILVAAGWDVTSSLAGATEKP